MTPTLGDRRLWDARDGADTCLRVLGTSTNPLVETLKLEAALIASQHLLEIAPDEVHIALVFGGLRSGVQQLILLLEQEGAVTR